MVEEHKRILCKVVIPLKYFDKLLAHNLLFVAMRFVDIVFVFSFFFP